MDRKGTFRVKILAEKMTKLGDEFLSLRVYQFVSRRVCEVVRM